MVGRAGNRRLNLVDRRGLGCVQALTLRNAVGDIEKNDVAETLQTGEVGERPTDITGTDQCDLFACHEK